MGFLLSTGCSVALKRESQCLVSLTPEVIRVHEELANLEAYWQQALARRHAVFSAPLSSGTLDSASRGQTQAPRRIVAPSRWILQSTESPEQEGARRAAALAYKELADAKTRHRSMLTMYDQVYQRVRTRTEEEDILSEVRLVLMTGPASFLFYPIIRWNVRSVLWNGEDPDAATDPVTKFCTDRLRDETFVSERAYLLSKEGMAPRDTQLMGHNKSRQARIGIS
jgi:hypothetical protein